MITIASFLVLALPPAPLDNIETQEADATPAGGALLVHGEKVYVSPSVVLEDASVLVEHGRIVAVGKGLVAPDGAREIRGKVVCPGFIDPWATFGLEQGAVGDQRTSAASLTTDALDPYVDPRLRTELLRAGVTVVRLQAGVDSRVGGVGAVLRNHPTLEPEDTLVQGESCLAFTIGVTRDGRGVDLFDRVAEVDRVVGWIGDGMSYLQDKLEYSSALEEWEKAIAEKEAELEKGFKKAKKDREKDEAEAKEKGKEYKPKSYKEDRKPREPRFDADKEILARAANGEIPVVIEAHRSMELRNLLEGTKDFDRLRLIIAGGTEAMSVAEQLVSRRIPVIVWPAPLGTSVPDELDGMDLGLAGELEAAGVQVLLGSGGSWPPVTRDLPLLAALAVGHGLDRQAAFEALTTRAARALDVGDRIGSLERGKDADLLILDGEPLAATTRVRFVISGGDVVVEE